MSCYQDIHRKALSYAKNFHIAQAKLLEVIQEIDRKKIFRKLGYSSTFDYCIRSLKLSESQTSAFISVARKSSEVPELKKAIDNGKINVSKAKRICSVIEKDNHEDWIEKAANLTQHEVQREVVKVRPKEIVPDRMQPVTPDHTAINCTVSTRVENKIRRVKEVLLQIRRKSCDMEQALEAMADLFLEKHDPVLKARRNLSKPNNATFLRNEKGPIPAPIAREPQEIIRKQFPDWRVLSSDFMESSSEYIIGINI